MNVQPSCCLDVVVYMLNYVFWRYILLEIEFKVVLIWAQIAIGILHSGIAHERQPNFRHRKKKENRKIERGEFITPPRPTGRRSNKSYPFLIKIQIIVDKN